MPFDLDARLSALSSLPFNWDSYNGLPITKAAINEAHRILDPLKDLWMPEPWIVPTNSGGLQIEYHLNGIGLEIGIDRFGGVKIFYERFGKERRKKRRAGR